MPLITQKEYKNLLQRQERVEREVNRLKAIVRTEDVEAHIKPEVLKRWERISRDIDSGKGRVFSSVDEMRKWLKKL